MRELNVFLKIQNAHRLFADEITPDIQRALNGLAANISAAAYNMGKQYAESKLDTTRDQYVSNLKLDKLSPSTYLISLDPSVNHLEDGYCVLYNPRLPLSTHPKVYTENGRVPISRLKIGDMVLNSDGQFTPIMAIHERDFLGDIRLQVEKFNTIKSTYPSDKGRLRSSVVLKCPRCRKTTHGAIMAYRSHRGISAPYCIECAKSKFFVKIYLSATHAIIVTSDHKVMTTRGYVEAGSLKESDYLLVLPSCVCKQCQIPFLPKTKDGLFCSRSCAVTYGNLKLVKEGKHIGQTEVGVKLYLENRSKAQKNSKLELAFEKYFKPLGVNYIRQYPKSIRKSNGTTVTYVLDFYLPKYNMGIELDGVAFHDQARDNQRDSYLKSQHGIDILRITDIQWKKDYKGCIKKVLRRLNNHDAKYHFIKYKPYKIKKQHVRNGFNIPIQFDITVADKHSYVCQDILIHNSSFDMKPGLLNGPKARYTKGGVKFNIIPFRIGAKEAAPVLKYGSAVAPRDFTQTWKKDFGGALNAKKAGISGIQRGADGTPLQGVVGRVGRNKNVPPNLQGMNKIQKTYGKTTQSQYMTFRTVSSKSKPSSWQHPGFKGIQAFQEIERFADAEINRFVSSLKF